MAKNMFEQKLFKHYVEKWIKKISNIFALVIINIKIFSILRKNGAHVITKKDVWENIYCSHLFWTCKRTFKTSSISIKIEHWNFSSNWTYFKKKFGNPIYWTFFMIFQKYKIIVLSTIHNSVEWFFEFKKNLKNL